MQDAQTLKLNLSMELLLECSKTAQTACTQSALHKASQKRSELCAPIIA